MHHTTAHRGPAGRREDPAIWRVVLPVKRLSEAKTRLLTSTVPAGDRARLAIAFATDTLRAALACPLVGEVLVVTDDTEVAVRSAALGARVLTESTAAYVAGHARLNAAIEQGAAAAGRPVCALTADLPALRPEHLTVALTAAGAHDRAFIADRQGSGTTLLSAVRGQLRPAFGHRSAPRHAASGAIRLPVVAPSLRLDVDQAADLAAAIRLGVGPDTTRALAETPTGWRGPVADAPR